MEIKSEYLNAAGIGYLECDKSGNILYFNDAACLALGLLPEKRGETLIRLSESYSNHLSVKEKDSFTLCVNSGTRDKYISHNIVDRSNDRISMIIKDITSTSDLEKELQENREKMKTMLTVIPDIVYRVDENGIIEYISESISRYGYTQEELIGTDIMNLIHPDDHERARRRILERRTGERMTRFFELRILTRTEGVLNVEFDSEAGKGDAMVFSMCAQGVYKKNGRDEKIFVGTQGVYQDITEKKQYELALRNSEEKWVTVMETIEDGYYETDLNGRILYVNRALCEKLGYQKEEMIGTNFSRYVEKEEKQNIVDFFLNTLKNEKSNTLKDWTAITRDGKKIIFQASASVIKTNNSNSVFYNGILRDISEMKRMEHELLMARKLEAIGILAGGIAHDYNNALTAIIGNLSLAKMDINDKESDLFEAINDAENAALRVKDLTQQLSTFSKGGKPAKKMVSIEPVIRKAIEDIIGKSRKGKYKYDFKVEPDAENVDIDEFQIGHVFEYILNNAMESMPDGGKIAIDVKNVSISSEQSHHGISLQPARYLQICVTDEGEGIRDEDMEKIFDPYYSTKEMGSGMGLAISYAVIKRHKGYIDVESKVGEGTSFCLYLPIDL